MAFIGKRIPEIRGIEKKTELTIALNRIGKSHSNLLFNEILEVLTKYCENDDIVYALYKNGAFHTIHDYENDYLVVFSNEYLAIKYNNGSYEIRKIEFTKILEFLMTNTNIKGINFDRDTSGLIVDTVRIMNKIFGARNIYQIDLNNWGEGIPNYDSSQIMSSEMMLDFGLQIVAQNIEREGHTIIHASNKLNSIVNIISSKNNTLYFINVQVSIAPKKPFITQDIISRLIDISYKYGVKAYYAPVGFGSTDKDRFNESLALQGDLYYADFVGLKSIESQLN